MPWLVKVATREAIVRDKRNRRWADGDDDVIAEVAADRATELGACASRQNQR